MFYRSLLISCFATNFNLPSMDTNHLCHLALTFFICSFKVNNVGTNIRKRTTEYSAEDYSFMMATNLESAYHLCQLTHPLLKASGFGSIVFISSVVGVVAASSGTLYAMTKGNCCRPLPTSGCDFRCTCKHEVFQTSTVPNQLQVLFRCH
jgi:hypothetical protein